MTDHYIHLQGCLGDTTINFQLYTMEGTEGKALRDYLSRLATSLHIQPRDYGLHWSCHRRKVATEVHDDTNLQQAVPLGTVLHFVELKL